MKRAGVIINIKRDADFKKTRRVMEILTEVDIEALLPELKNSYAEETIFVFDESMFVSCDFVLSLGGDGTILAVAEKAALNGIPIFGINIGNVGYLTDCSFEEAETALKKFKSGDYTLEKRMMLRAEVESNRALADRTRCLNDVCITSGAASQIIHFKLFINGKFLDNYNADGIIISTPTGSTAYNLSAGGSILMPNAEMLAITPICPHMLTSRPIIVSSVDEISVEICGAKKETILTLDGGEPSVLESGDVVKIARADEYTEIIKTNNLGFYDVLRKKLIFAK